MTRRTLLLIVAVVLLAIGLFVRARYWYPIENRTATGTVVVALGDSLTYGTGAPRGEDWPSLVSQRCNCTIINKGVPGETTADAYKRLQSDVLGLDPKIVVVGLGGNDILQQLPRDQMFTNLRQIIEDIQKSGAMVVVLGLNGFPFGGDLASGYSQLARDTGSVYIPNLLGGILTDQRLKSDQFHPNAAGYKLIADKIYDKIEPYL
jgi:lysophospholipase L1-like esterase